MRREMTHVFMDLFIHMGKGLHTVCKTSGANPGTILVSACQLGEHHLQFRFLFRPCPYSQPHSQLWPLGQRSPERHLSPFCPLCPAQTSLPQGWSIRAPQRILAAGCLSPALARTARGLDYTFSRQPEVCLLDDFWVLTSSLVAQLVGQIRLQWCRPRFNFLGWKDPGEGRNGYHLFLLGESHGGTGGAAVHGLQKSQTRLSKWTITIRCSNYCTLHSFSYYLIEYPTTHRDCH